MRESMWLLHTWSGERESVWLLHTLSSERELVWLLNTLPGCELLRSLKEKCVLLHNVGDVVVEHFALV